MAIYGIDIGGKNIKLASVDNRTRRIRSWSVPSFPGQIEAILREEVVKPELVVCTETFSARRASAEDFTVGFRTLNKMLLRSFGKHLMYLSTDFRLLTPKEASGDIWKVVCRNWSATAYLLVREANVLEDGLIVDCGTSSLDVIPVVGGRMKMLCGARDRFYQRFRTGEFLWSGTFFTPVAAFTDAVKFRGKSYAINPSTKACSGDVYIVSCKIKPADLLKDRRKFIKGDLNRWKYWREAPSREASARALRELIMIDPEYISNQEVTQIATFLQAQQRRRTAMAVQKVASECQTRYRIRMTNVVVVGIGKEAILKPALRKEFTVVDGPEKIVQRLRIARKDYSPNCETALGCALRGLRHRYGEVSWLKRMHT